MLKLTTSTDPVDDANECERLERKLLTVAQKQYLDAERHPRWELNPPQREEYDAPRSYVLALAQYVNAAIDAERREAHEDSYWDDPLRGSNKC